MQPLRMQPVLKERVWGGRRLADLLGKDLPDEAPIGESWELADHPNGRNLIADGPFAGKTLRWVLENHAGTVLGRKELAQGAGARFPVLVKFIDAADRLSVQVHPDDARAASHHKGDRGKTECWTVVHAEPGAWVIDGLKSGTTREQLEAALEEGTVEKQLNVRQVEAGDFIWVPAGRVHAVGPGVVFAEVQQNSDVTYRLYDWGRMGLDGKPRALHVAEALEAAAFGRDELPSGGRGKTADETGLVIEHLADCHAFSLSRIQLDRRPWAGDMRDAYVAIIALAGTARLRTADGATPIRPGDTILVPAEAGEYVLEEARRLTVLVAAPPGNAPTE